MKKTVSLLLAILLVLSLFLLPASASYTPKYGMEAEKLWQAGLFLGTGTSFDLDRPLTRAQGVTMMVRLLGAERAAMDGSWSTPFADVPAWAKQYVGYAYAHGLTDGTAPTAFTPDAAMPATQFLTLALRALGYDDAAGDFRWDRAESKAIEIGLTQGGEFSGEFLRDHAAYIAWNALDTNLKGTSTRLINTIKLPGRPEGYMPSRASYMAGETGRITVTSSDPISCKVGDKVQVTFKAKLGSNPDITPTMLVQDKSVATASWDGTGKRGGLEYTSSLTLTAQAAGSTYLTLTMQDRSVLYDSVKIPVTVTDAVSPTPTPTPPQSALEDMPFTFRSSGTDMVAIGNMPTYLNFWLTGCKDCTVEVGDVDSFAVNTPKESGLSVRAFVEDSSVATCVDIAAQYDMSLSYPYTGYFHLDFLGHKTGTTEVVVFLYIDGWAFQRVTRDVTVVPAGSLPPPYVPDCGFCNDTRLCLDCGSCGIIYDYFNRVWYDCPTCHGSGVCQYCLWHNYN